MLPTFKYIPKGMHFTLLIAILFLARPLSAQQPFECNGQLFLIGENGQELVGVSFSPGSNALVFNTLNANLGVEISALGFRRTDGLLYGIGKSNKRLYRMDAMGIVDDLGQSTLNNNLQYLAGEVTPNGQYFVALGSQNGVDKEFVKIDLTNNYSVQISQVSSSVLTADIAFDPLTGQLFGYNSNQRQVTSIDSNTGASTPFPAIETANEIQGVYFDTFGNLKAYGTALNGVVSAIFNINKSTGKESLFTTAGLLPIADMAACPYSVEILNAVDPQSSFPCNQITYTYSISNASQSPVSGVDLIHELPIGFEILDVAQNPYGGTIDASTPSNILRINNMNISTGIKNMAVNVEIGDLPGGNYNSKVRLQNLPASLGSVRSSDDPNTITFGDSTKLEINRFDEDSIFYDRFLCIGESTVLDASDFGNNIHWNSGSTLPQQTVNQSGVYSLEAVSGCQTIFVSFEVVTASCPYTIELGHSIIPDTVFPCSEVTFRYYLENDSGEKRFNVGFLDILPSTFTIIDLLPNPYGGTLRLNQPPNVVAIDGMTLIEGIDSFDIIVKIGDIVPGNYLNGAEINNLPYVLGEKRFSDDPNTQLVDDTRLVVKGVEADTSYLDTILCFGEILILDASPFGTSYVWPDGSSETTYPVGEAGIYEVQIFDGCEPSLVYFNVEEGTPIRLSISDPFFEIHQGDSILISPIVINAGDSLTLLWNDPIGATLSCYACESPYALPLTSTTYTLMASNELCSDSLLIHLEVDETRRVYAPNIFSPNADGINDYFFLQSPDKATIHSLIVANRWGGIIFKTDGAVFNEERSGWNGFFKGKLCETGIYTWFAEIEFIDGKKELFMGGVNLVK